MALVSIHWPSVEYHHLTCHYPAGWRSNIETRLNIISRVTLDTAERKALISALFVQVFHAVRELRDEQGSLLFPTPASLHPRFATPGTPQLLADYGTDIGGWARGKFAQCEM